MKEPPLLLSTSKQTAPAAPAARPGLRRAWRTGRARTPLYGALLVVAVMYLFPLLYLINAALKTPQAFLFDPTGVTKSLDISNFGDAWVRGGRDEGAARLRRGRGAAPGIGPRW